jgi:hypothetical protein
MTVDPVTRAARRQNLLDRLAEQLTDWGCPPDTAPVRAGGLLIIVEAGGWALPTVDAPPIRGRGSTREGRARARAEYEAARVASRATSTPSRPQDKIDGPPGYPYDPQTGTERSRGSLRWHYGPTDTDPEPGRMWCNDCGSEVYGFKEGYVCNGCGRAEALA